jgi:hypothetical protein
MYKGARDMATREPIGEMIFKRALSNYPDEESYQDSTVLSCGGIYIPHKGDSKRRLHQILNTARKDEPVKLVSQNRNRNVLREILMKENMN